MRGVRAVVAVALALVCVAAVASASRALTEQQNKLHAGQTKCLVCTLGLQIVKQQLQKGEKNIVAALDNLLCSRVPETWRIVCDDFMNIVGADIIRWLIAKEDPDAICHSLKMCDQCSLLPRHMLRGNEQAQVSQAFGRLVSLALLNMKLGLGDGTALPDIDKDEFSAMHLLRGADWRGKDCNDLAPGIHPGAPVVDGDRYADHNCNGVVGADAQGKAYEDEFCSATDGPAGLLVLGDSASAGFRIPQEWLDLKDLKSILSVAVDELDFPQLAWASGWSDLVQGDSLYSEMFEQNHCVHRNFNNIAKNGGVWADMVEQVERSNVQTFDKPLLVTAAYIGNDVCHNTLEEMTTVEELTAQATAGLAALDKVVKPGTKVIVLGFVDGRILWDTMHNLTHPLGVTYEQFYDFLACTGSNPCRTWLNPDESTRDAASLRAAELSVALEEVVASNTYQNMEVVYMDFPLDEAMQELVSEGRPAHDLIEEVDGFHPSIDYGHRLIARLVWRRLVADYPSFVSGANPHNADIVKVFGDQGGY